MSTRQPSNPQTRPQASTTAAGSRLRRPAPSPLALEQRFMFDGAGAVDVAHAAMDAALAGHAPTDALVKTAASVIAMADPSAHRAVPATLESAVGAVPATPSLADAHEIVFIDPSVANYQTLVADVRPGVLVITLTAGQDPWQQMSAVIAQYQNLTAIHVVSHGANGEILFGEQAFRAADLQAQASTLASWQPHLAKGADLLLYGCDIGAGTDGQALVSTLARMTGTDVAASSDATGAAALGGNWTLETSSGRIESRIAFGTAVLNDYGQLLVATPQTIVVTTGTNVDSTAATTGLVGAGKLITFDPVTLTMGATSNAMLITGYDVDYGMKDASGNPYPVGNAASEWDGVYIKLHGSADTAASWKFVGFLNGLNNTWITTTTFDVTSQMTAFGMTAGQSNSYDVRVVPDDNGTQTQANNGGRWVVGASKLQFSIDGGSSHTAVLGTPTETNAAVSVVVTPTATATYTVLFNLVDSTGRLVAGYNTTLPMTNGVATTVSGSMLANTTLYSSNAFANVPAGTYTLQVSVLDSAGVQQDTKSVSETITSSAGTGGSGGGAATTTVSSKSSPNYTIITGNTSWTGSTPADTQHLATADATPTLTGWVYASSSGTGTRTVSVYVDGTLLGSTTTASGVGAYSSTYHGYAWTYTLTPAQALVLGSHTFTAQRTGTTGTVQSSPYSLVIDGNTRPAITGLASYSGSSTVDVAHTGTASSTPTLTGTASPFASLYLYDTIGGVTTLLGATTANSGGVWAYTVAANSPLSNGNYSFTTTDQSFSGSSPSPTSLPYALVIDSTAPTITVANVHISNDTGSSSTDFVTAAQQQSITATLSTTLSGSQQLLGSLDGGLTWTDVTSSVTGTTLTWTSQLLRSGYADPSQFTPWSIQFKVSSGVSSPQYGAIDSVDYRYVGSISDPTITRTGWVTASTPALYGLADPNSIVTIRSGSTVLGTATPDSSGNWSFTPGTPFADGNYTLTATASDPYSGAASAHPASISLTIDSTLPVISGIHISADTGSVTTDFITSTATQTITATLSTTLQAGQALYGSVDGGATWTAVTPIGTAISWVGRTLAGSSSIEFQARNTPTGAIGATDVQGYTLDTTAPVLVSSGLAATFSATDGTVTLVFNEAGSGLDASIVPATTAFAVAGGGSAISAVTVDAANNTVVLTVSGTPTSVSYTKPGTGNTLRDLAGNSVATFAGHTVVATDALTTPNAPTLTLPAASDSGTLNNDLKTSNSTPTVHLVLSSPTTGDVVDVYSNGISVGTAVLTAANVTANSVDIVLSNLGSDGAKNLTATETNAASLVSLASNTLALTLDTTAPTLNTAAVNGTSLVLSFNEFGTGLASVAASASLAPGNFSVTRNGGIVVSVSAVSVDTVAQTVTLTLGTSISSADNVILSYTSGSNRLQDVAGNLFASLSSQTVINNSPDTTAPAAPALALNAASDSGTLSNDAKTNVDTPSVRVTLNGSGSTAPLIGDTVKVYLGATLVGSASLSVSDISNGYIDITTSTLGSDGAKSLTAKVTDAASNTSTSSNTLAIVLDRTALVVSGATTDGANLVLSYTELGSGLASTSPAAGDFSVAHNGFAVGVTAVAVDAANRTLTLTLAAGIVSGDTVTVSYVPGASKTQDVAGNTALGFSAFAVTNNVGISVPTETVTISAVTDAVSPLTGTIANNGYTNDPSPIISGTLSADLVGSEVVAVYRDGVLRGSATITAGTQWSYQDTGLVDGTSYVYTAQVEASGVHGTPSATYTITEDSVAPVPTISLNSVTADNTLNAAEAGANVTIGGTVGGEFNSGDTVTLVINGVNYTGTVDNTGAFSIAVAGSDLAADSDHSIAASVATSDAAGNAGSARASKAYAVDTVAPVPTISLNSVTADNTLNAAEAAGSVAISGTVGGNFTTGDSVTLVINGVNYTGAVDSAGAFSISVPGANLAADSDHAIAASVATSDAAGNTGSASASKVYAVDTARPAAPTVDTQTTTSSAPTVTGTAALAGAETLTITVGAATYAVTPDSAGKWSLDLSSAMPTHGALVPLSPGGTYQVTATVTDAAGNSSSDLTSNELMVVNAPTEIVSILSMTKDTGVSATDFITSDGSAGRTVSGELSAALAANEMIEVSFDGGATWTVAITSGTGWSASDDAAHSVNWTIEARVTQTEAHASSAVSSQMVTLDTSAPNAPTVAAVETTFAQPLISGTFDAGDAAGGLSVTLDGRTYVLGLDAALSTRGNSWTLDLTLTTQTLTPSAYDVAVSVTDRAGNTRTDTSQHELVVVPVPLPPPEAVAPPTAPTAFTPPVVSPEPAPRADVAPPAIVVEPAPPVEAGRHIDDLLTAPGTNATRIPVVPAPEAALFRYQGVPDQSFDVGTNLRFRLPSDAFVHTREDATVVVQVQRTDGGPLPSWLRFDATTGMFEGTVPEGAPSVLEIRVTARDNEGREATSIFRIEFLQHEKPRQIGRAGLSEQIRKASARTVHLDGLARLDRVAKETGKWAATI